MQGATLAVVVKGFPRLSETFVARELEALEKRGLRFTIHALRSPGKDAALVQHGVAAACLYLPEYLHEAPMTVLRGLMTAIRLPGFWVAAKAFWQDLKRDFSRARVRRFGQACVLTSQLAPEVRHLYCHFAHSPGSVARYAAMMMGLRYSLSAHAKDVWTDPVWDLQQKVSHAAFVTTCNQAAFARLSEIAPEAKLLICRHGVSPALLAVPRPHGTADGSDGGTPVRILCVARAVEKKGLDCLLSAAALLPAGLNFVIEHIGDGELLPHIKARCQSLGLANRVRFLGAMPHADVISAMDRADIFVFPAAVAQSGDRDGVPNVILEANARGLCVVACDAGGVKEAVLNGVTGMLVNCDPAALAHALTDAIRQPALRLALTAEARRRNEALLDGERGFEVLATELKTLCSPR